MTLEKERFGNEWVQKQLVIEEVKILKSIPTAEQIKIAIGAALPLKENPKMAVKGRDLAGGLPKIIEVKSNELKRIFQYLKTSIDLLS